MSISESLFGITLENLTYHTLENYFIEEKEESDRLEFKSFHAGPSFRDQFKSIKEGLTGFLNSDGGILIWGAPVETPIPGTTRKRCIGHLTPMNEAKDKDDFVRSVNSSITPFPVGIKLNKITGHNGYILVFEIERSRYSPHQFDNTYFARIDGQTIKAPHYLIESLFRKITYPNLG